MERTGRKRGAERGRAEERLGLISELINRSAENLSVIDIETGRFLYVNDTCCASTGFSREEFLRMRVADIDPSAAGAWSPEEERSARSRKATRLREGLIKRKDGTVFPVEVSSSIAIVAGREYLIATARDITGRRRTEEEQSRRRTFLRQVIDMIPDFLFVKDREDRYLLANRQLAKAYGTTHERMLGKTDVELGADPVQAARFSEAGREVLRSRRDMVTPDEEFTVASGETRRFQTTRRPLADERGEIARVLAVSVDITERLQMQEQLLHAQKMETVGRLAGGIAHDFNNLLSIILNCASFIDRGLPPDSPLRHDSRQILSTVNRCVDLTRKLLTFSRRQIINPRVIGVNGFLRSMETMLRRLVRERVLLEFRLAPDTGAVCVDRGQLEHLLINLCINADDAMRDGGTLTVRTACAAPPAAGKGAAAAASGDFVMIAVRDTGTGMSEEVQARIFEPYFTTKEGGQGTGLGLPSIYGIVKQNGGAIEVESAPGKGSEFRVYLPRAGSSPGVSASSREAPAPARGVETVLLAEDEQMVRAVTARMLREHGYTVLEAESGDDALRLARAFGPQRVSLLVTDVVMPGMSGKKLVEELRREAPGLRVVYISGYPQEELGRNRELEPGVAFLSKPFSGATLAAKVREILDAPAPRTR
jgi:PAS domain S-box-containing protein